MAEPVAVHTLVEGDPEASPLVLSNSLGSTPAMWDPQAPALAERFRLIRYDHRGHGSSPVPPGPYSLADLGGDLLALLDRLAIERASFCGLSIGGMVGMWLGANAPERVDKLILCCTSAKPARDPQMWYERAALVREEGTQAVADAVLVRWLTPDYAAAHPDVADRLKAMIVATPDEGYAGCCEAIAEIDLEADLGRIRAPTLVIAGAEDPSFSPDHSERIAAGIPNARRELLSPAAHLANVERADDVRRLILDFLEER
jgi:3-oxoadipate enol-lactonase